MDIFFVFLRMEDPWAGTSRKSILLRATTLPQVLLLVPIDILGGEIQIPTTGLGSFEQPPAMGGEDGGSAYA
jgi:hypothetical protein